MVKDPKFARFYLLPKIHKRLHDVPGRPVISNCGYYTENISSFLDFHLQPLAREVKFYIKGTNDFLKKLRSSPNLPDDIILYTVDVVGLYPNIPHKFIFTNKNTKKYMKELKLKIESDLTKKYYISLQLLLMLTKI